MLSKIISQENIDHFNKWFERGNSFVIVGHVSPDGDAIGASLALWHFLKSHGKEAVVAMPNSFPDFLAWLPGSSDILFYDRDKTKVEKALGDADVVCCLDFNTPKRVDRMEDALVASPARKIMIDHHLYPSDFCKIIISHPELSSTSELVFRLICRMGYWDDLSYECAQCVYTGMMTDTGAFTYNSNDPEIYFIISRLLTKGINKDEIYRKVYNNQTESRMRLMGFVLDDKMSVLREFATAVITLRQYELNRYGYRKGDTEGFVNMPLSIKGIKLSIFLREEKDLIKVSLRSVGELRCNEIAERYFGGGGHKNASGGEFYGTMEEAENVLKRALVEFQDTILAAK